MASPQQRIHSSVTGKIAPSPSMSAKTNPIIDANSLRELRRRGFTEGLVQALLENKDAFAKRIWIVDNSSSKLTQDGHCIISTTPRHVSFRDCSRWEEIQETVIYHMELAELIQAPTEFRFLNRPRSRMTPQRISIATDESSYRASTAAAKLRRMCLPSGCTPLTQHINDIHKEVSRMEAELRRTGKRVAIVIATDGLPTDAGGLHSTRVRQAFVSSLRSLEGLPVWLVIRLSTDDNSVVDFYNELDNVLELSIDVLDDFSAEAEEVHENNPWINYALPLHRMREMGFHDRLFDLIDQSKLTRSDVRDVCALILGDTKFDGVPDPAVDWTGFVNSIGHLFQTEEEQWNPIKKRQKPWISINRLNRVYGKKRWF